MTDKPEMPDEIYADMDKHGSTFWFSEPHDAFGKQVRYIRADLARPKDTKAALEALTRVDDYLDACEVRCTEIEEDIETIRKFIQESYGYSKY